MTKDQIKAELRRSACEDFDPWFYVKGIARDECRKFCHVGEGMAWVPNIDCATFFLLVAEAL